MTTEPLRPGDRVDSKAITNSTSAELLVRCISTEYDFEVTSAPVMGRVPQSYVGKDSTPTQVMPKRITLTVRRYVDRHDNQATELRVQGQGHRVLKSGEVSDAILMDIRFGYNRTEWPEWVQDLASQFEDGTLS